MKKKHVIVLVVLAVLAAGAVSAALVIKGFKADFERQMAEIVIGDVDLAKIPDGTYDGGCKVVPIQAEVRVTVENHKITAIELVRHINGRGQSAEVLPGKVIEAQSAKVDLVSGATYSSKVILKAIENALAGAVK